MPSSTRAAPEPDRPTVDGLFRERSAHVLRMLQRMGVPAADLDDAVQDAFLVVIAKLPDYEPRGRVVGWLATIVARVAAEHRRMRGRLVLTADGDAPATEPPGHVPSVEGTVAAREIMDRLLAAITDEKHRTAFVLYEIEELTLRETAVACDAPETTVKGWLRVAHEQFVAAAARLGVVSRASTGVAPPAGIFALLASERMIPPLPADVFARLRARIEASPEYQRLPHAGDRDSKHRRTTPPAEPGVPRWAAALIALAFLGIGASWHRLQEAPRAPITAAPDTFAILTPLPSPQAPTPLLPPAPPATAAPPDSAAAPAPGALGVGTEATLMLKTSTTLASGETATALAMIAEHARRFPERHAEWREQMRAQARLQQAAAAPAP